MRIFGGERLKKTMERIGMKEGESIEHRMVSRSIEKAQEKVEKHNFDIRKHLIEYDDVMNQQRNVIYQYRRNILDGGDNSVGLVKDMISDVVHGLFEIHCPNSVYSEENKSELFNSIEKLTGIKPSVFESVEFKQRTSGNLESAVCEYLIYLYEQFRKTILVEFVDRAEKWILLETIDHAWKQHLLNIDHLKEGIGLRGYGQKNPLIEYKKESFSAFQIMIGEIKWDIAQRIFKMKPDDSTMEMIEEIEEEKEKELDSLQLGGSSEVSKPQPAKRATPKVGRNEPCTCGSGKKFKHCCGK
jgi:preprotein translocase subunit SecA